MSGERLEVAVTFDPVKGYIATAPELKAPVVALSLSGPDNRSPSRRAERPRPVLQSVAGFSFGHWPDSTS
jgi:hypothetical protein